MVCSDLSQFRPSEKYDRLIHLAWQDVGKHADYQNLLDNIQGQFQFLNNMVVSGIRDLTVTGTCLEYGMQEGPMPETNKTEPVSSYGLAKLTLYKMLAILQDQQPFSFKWLRCFYVYGENQRPHALLSQLLRAIEEKQKVFNMSPGDQKRDFIHVDTMARNIITIAMQNEVQGAINAGNGTPTSVLDFVKAVMEQKQCELELNRQFYPYHSYEPFAFWADTTKLKSIPGIQFDDRIIV
ncbi:MAG: NAD-dependent epimerase/dehydratase family protein [Alphaproteobacteria bacterium]|nr:NAD-dependent epimerase/dehydratase family protein [Alphaproteobacteria bacterium]